MSAENRQNKFYYGWVIVAVSTLALIVSNGLSTLGIPVFYPWIRAEFVKSGAVDAGSAESFIANGATLTFLVAGFFSPIAGYLIQKFRIRNLMIIGCFILGSGLLLHSQTEQPMIVYLSRILMGMSLGFVGVLANMVLVSNWFRRLRGTALGIVTTGTSIGGFLIPLIATPLILSYGWRTAMVAISFLIWLVLLPAIIFFVKDKPSDIGLLPDGSGQWSVISGQPELPEEFEKSEDQRPKTEDRSLTLAQALKTPLFWVFALCAGLIFYPIFATSQQFILYLQTPRIGLSPEQGALALSLLFAVSVGGKFLFGFLSDKFSPTRVMLLCCAIMFSATLFLLSLTPITAFIFLIPFGLGYGGTFVLLQRLVADYFGMREYGKILGVIIVVETLGAAIGGKITGRLADASGGDYTQAFYMVIVVTGLALGLVLVLNAIYKKREVLV
ncbi:MAG TPA: MFS transporter [Pyrinomonadaceae bacterium]|nr:MFS transporter [Pyrinomonadaceae bacterium]